MSNFEKVKNFMRTFGQSVKNKAEFPEEKVIKLRSDLIKEELAELEEAIKEKDLIEIADALTDILYVTYGAGTAFGIDLDKCFDEVHNSNMSKLGEDGKPIYNEQGKVMKGPKYFKPDLKKLINI
jgi:predicted HAD superfamily Cof-like phosphohydrolase|tara:strand:- start:21006 stop:21380 length:375 start_codon:yes stop_codon:yes gene_type:complete